MKISKKLSPAITYTLIALQTIVGVGDLIAFAFTGEIHLFTYGILLLALAISTWTCEAWRKLCLDLRQENDQLWGLYVHATTQILGQAET